MELSPLPMIFLLILLLPASHSQEEPVLSVSPQSWLTEGDSVTLNCEVTDSSTDWTFRWFRKGPYSNNNVTYKDSSRGSQGSYTLSPAALKHTGVYSCSAVRERSQIETGHSNLQPIWITGESPPVSLIINPSRTQHFTDDSLSLNCEDESNSTGWTVRQYSGNGVVKECSWLGASTGSTCKIKVQKSYTGVYWCESESGENSNPVNITVHDGDVILESPVHPVTEGHPLTLRCLYRNTKPSNLRADFYKDGSVLQKQTTGEMIIHKVSKSDEGFYHCKNPWEKESEKSWVSVRVLHGESPPVSLIINPSRTQHFTGDSLSLSCEDQSHSTGWTVRRYTHSESVSDCSQWGSVTGSTCNISSLNITYTGVYWCESKSRENSNPVNITVYDSSPRFNSLIVVSAGLGAAILFIVALMFIILLLCRKRNKEKQQKTDQTSEQNQNRSASEDSQSGHTPLQAGEAAAESSEITSAPVTKKPKANRKNDVDAEPSGSDVTYAELEMEQKKTARGKTETASVDADTVYSEVKLNTE